MSRLLIPLSNTTNSQSLSSKRYSAITLDNRAQLHSSLTAQLPISYHWDQLVNNLLSWERTIILISKSTSAVKFHFNCQSLIVTMMMIHHLRYQVSTNTVLALSKASLLVDFTWRTRTPTHKKNNGRLSRLKGRILCHRAKMKDVRLFLYKSDNTTQRNTWTSRFLSSIAEHSRHLESNIS